MAAGGSFALRSPRLTICAPHPTRAAAAGGLSEAVAANYFLSDLQQTGSGSTSAAGTVVAGICSSPPPRQAQCAGSQACCWRRRRTDGCGGSQQLDRTPARWWLRCVSGRLCGQWHLRLAAAQAAEMRSRSDLSRHASPTWLPPTGFSATDDIQEGATRR